MSVFPYDTVWVRVFSDLHKRKYALGITLIHNTYQDLHTVWKDMWKNEFLPHLAYVIKGLFDADGVSDKQECTDMKWEDMGC